MALIIPNLIFIVALGLPEGALGTAWPSMRMTFGRSVGELGLLLAVNIAAYATGSLINGRAAARFGVRARMATALAVVSLGLAGMVTASVWSWLLAASATLALGGGAIDAGLNAHFAVHHSVRAMNMLHASYGIGATLGPLLITAVLALDRSWRGGYAIILALVLVLTAVVLTGPGVRMPSRPPSLPGQTADTGSSRAIVLWSMLVLFFAYTGVEVATGQWSFSLLTEGRGFSDGSAGFWVAAYWGGLTAGRLLYGVVGDRLAPQRLLDLSMATATLGLTLLWWAPTDLVGALGLPVAGFGLAGVFPVLVLLTPKRVGAHRADRVVSFELAAAALGAAAVPALAGILIEAGDLSVLGPFLTVAMLGLALLNYIVARLARPPAPVR